MSSPLRILIAGFTSLVLLTSAFSNDLLPNPPSITPHGTGGGLVILPGQSQAMFRASAGEDIAINLPSSMEGASIITSLAGSMSQPATLQGSTLFLAGIDLAAVHAADVASFQIMMIGSGGFWLGAVVDFDSAGNVTVSIR